MLLIYVTVTSGKIYPKHCKMNLNVEVSPSWQGNVLQSGCIGFDPGTSIYRNKLIKNQIIALKTEIALIFYMNRKYEITIRNVT